ncbi:unnamed protein product, partial [Amoebophrya sp. A25]
PSSLSGSSYTNKKESRVTVVSAQPASKEQKDDGRTEPSVAHVNSQNYLDALNDILSDDGEDDGGNPFYKDKKRRTNRSLFSSVEKTLSIERLQAVTQQMVMRVRESVRALPIFSKVEHDRLQRLNQERRDILAGGINDAPNERIQPSTASGWSLSGLLFGTSSRRVADQMEQSGSPYKADGNQKSLDGQPRPGLSPGRSGSALTLLEHDESKNGLTKDQKLLSATSSLVQDQVQRSQSCMSVVEQEDLYHYQDKDKRELIESLMKQNMTTHQPQFALYRVLCYVLAVWLLLTCVFLIY